MSNGPHTYFKRGSWNAVCDRCGGYFKAEQLKKDWQGWMLCERDWEPRHPQDFAHGVPDIMTTPWQRIPPAPNFVDVPIYIQPPGAGGGTGGGGGGFAPDPGGSISTPGSAVAGIAITGDAVSGTP